MEETRAHLSCLSKLLIGSLDFRARGQCLITIDSCYNEAHDLTFNVIGATMAYYDLIFNVIAATMVYYNLTFNVIGATMAYYDLTFNVIGATVESPSQNPLACLYKPRVCGNKAELLRWNPCRV